MEVVAGANEAEQTQPGAEQTPRKPEATSEQAPGTATATTGDPTATMGAAPGAATTAGSAAEAATEQAKPEEAEQTPQAPGFGERGRMRRRARFLRKARELAYRDLGGLVFDLHRFGQRNDQLVLAKLATLRQIDTELRELEQALGDRRPVTVLREVGIAACPRCAAIHGSDDRFCPGCGLAFDTNADRPISTAPVSTPSPSPAQTSATAQTPTTGQSRHAPPTPTPASAAAPSPTSVTPPAAPVTPPKLESPPPLRSTAAPVAANPIAPTPERKQQDRATPARPEEDEPTQILRPPAPGP
jgi:hypothetical protein